MTTEREQEQIEINLAGPELDSNDPDPKRKGCLPCGVWIVLIVILGIGGGVAYFMGWLPSFGNIGFGGFGGSDSGEESDDLIWWEPTPTPAIVPPPDSASEAANGAAPDLATDRNTPSPTDLPSTATPEPTPQPTDSPTPTPAPTPTPVPTATPIPTPAPTATPVPKPTSTPRPRATPTPVPTPTPGPTQFRLYNKKVNDQYSYSLEVPRSWSLVHQSSTDSVFRNSNGTAGIEVHIFSITRGDVGTLLQDRLNGLLGRARNALDAGVPDPFNMRITGQPGPGITDALWFARRSEYSWQETPDACLQDVAEVIAPSNSHSHAVRLTAWVCEKDLGNQQKKEREMVLESFEESGKLERGR